MEVNELAREMKKQRLALGLTHKTAVEAAGVGVSVANWSKIENGHAGEYRESTFAAIDRALKWPHGRALDLVRYVNLKEMVDDQEEITDYWVQALRNRVSALERRIGELLGGDIDTFEYSVVGDEYDEGALSFTFARIDAIEAKLSRLDALESRLESLADLVKQTAERALGPDADELPLDGENRAAQ
jgi:hypothetical protein